MFFEKGRIADYGAGLSGAKQLTVKIEVLVVIVIGVFKIFQFYPHNALPKTPPCHKNNPDLAPKNSARDWTLKRYRSIDRLHRAFHSGRA